MSGTKISALQLSGWGGGGVCILVLHGKTGKWLQSVQSEMEGHNVLNTVWLIYKGFPLGRLRAFPLRSLSLVCVQSHDQTCSYNRTEEVPSKTVHVAKKKLHRKQLILLRINIHILHPVDSS